MAYLERHLLRRQDIGGFLAGFLKSEKALVTGLGSWRSEPPRTPEERTSVP
jgi:hypothetical protein